MANILEYLHWRGDLPYETVPLNDVDLLILSRLSYAPFDNVVPGDFSSEGVPLAEACKRVLSLTRKGGDGRTFRMKDDEPLLEALMESPRYVNMRLKGYVNLFDENQQEQFSALTAVLPGGDAVLVFRGTDGTLVGWKEDFNMAYSDTVPAQIDAAAYAGAAAEYLTGQLSFAGHSKGGNLAVYAAAFGKGIQRERIGAVRSFDGPGFGEAILKTGEYASIGEKIRTILPQSSVVGMLLEHEESFSIVESKSVGIFQHNVYYWEIVRDGFINMESLTNSSRFVDDTLKNFVRDLSPEQREKMINGIFSVLGASEGKTLKELWNGRNTLAVIRAAGNLDEETKQVLSECFTVLKGSVKSALPAYLSRMTSPEQHIKKQG